MENGGLTSLEPEIEERRQLWRKCHANARLRVLAYGEIVKLTRGVNGKPGLLKAIADRETAAAHLDALGARRP